MSERSPGEAYRFTATVTCTRCGRRVDGAIMLSETNQVVDSEGFMVFADGLLCDSCVEKDKA